MRTRLLEYLVLFFLLGLVFLPSVSAQALVDDPKIFIMEDGTIVGTNNIQKTGNLYTFTNNVTGALQIQTGNIVIDGAGFTLTGGRNRGIVFGGAQGVTVKNLRVTLEGGYVIDLRDAVNCMLENNTLIGTPRLIPDLPPGPLIGPIAINFLHSQNITLKNNTIINFSSALSLEWSSGHTIVGNRLIDGIAGINLVNTTDCFFRDNRMVNCSFSVRSYSSYRYENDLDASNTIDGKPIYYWLNTQSKTVPSNAGYIVLVNCRDIIVENCQPTGIMIASTENSTISRVNMSGRRGDGINLLDCMGIKILDSTLSDVAIAIQLDNASNNIIKGNTISNYMTRGINLNGANNNLIYGNTLQNGSYAIASFQDTISTGNIVESNVFEDNGFALIVQGSMQVLNNTFIGNEQGILCYSGANTIIGNTFIANNRGLSLQSTGNILKNNRFNNNGDNLQINGANFANEVDSSNMLNGKPIIYWVNQHNQTVPLNAGYVVLANCTGIIAQNLTLANQNQGILLAFTTSSTITNNLIANNTNGIYLHGASGNKFVHNYITGNNYAIYIHGATFSFLGAPPTYVPSSDNQFYRNNFVGNNQTLYDVGGVYDVSNGPSENFWDDGKQGNFWSNYTGVDTNSDGIGDSRYVVYAKNTDNYPLMKPINMIVPETSALPSPTTSSVTSPSTSSSPEASPSSTVSPSPAPSIPEFTTLVIASLIAGILILVIVVKAKYSYQKTAKVN
jgi:parallel beta-helix repeat protein